MELIVILLSSISGALIGTSVGIYLLYRKLRPITGAELDLTRGKLRSTEFSLSSANASVENFRKQLEERDAQLAAAEAKSHEMETTLRQQLEDSKASEEVKAAAENSARQLAAFEARVEADDRQLKELNSQVARLTTELDQLRDHFHEESASRSNLSEQLTAEHDNTRRLASRVAELEAERSHFDLTMQEERQSAAKGIELLLMAQENLTKVFRRVQPDVHAEANGHELVGVAAIAGSE